MTARCALIAGLSLLAPALLSGAATIVIVNNDAAGVGFNDPTVVAPVGGNPGTTLGQQRLNAFQSAANKWGATLTSVPTIRVRAQWTALACTATGAVLGSAGPTQVGRDFAGALKSGTWYHVAEANALAGVTSDPATPEISANFNVNLGQPGCLTGNFFYLGLDNNHGSNVDLVTVLTHEFGHGLGFSTVTNGSSGAQLAGFPAIWDHYLMDNTTNKLWKDMTNAERVASAINDTHLVWTGPNVTANVPNVLGTPELKLTAPASVAGTYAVGTASFGPSMATVNVNAELMPVVDTLGGLGLACAPLNALNTAAVAGKIALVDRGTCGFSIKTKIAQNAGAIGVVIANNVAGTANMTGTDITITIPTVMVSQADANTLKAALATRSRLHSGMLGNIFLDRTLPLGADANGRALMYAPNPYQSGSSVSHYDVRTFPNALMEPAINADLTHEVTVPFDLSYQLLKDIGWQ